MSHKDEAGSLDDRIREKDDEEECGIRIRQKEETFMKDVLGMRIWKKGDAER